MSPLTSKPKSITTLVEDVYSLLSKDAPIPEARVEELGHSLIAMLKRRLSVPTEPRGLSMSSLGTVCKRQLWYKINKPELGEPLEPKARLNFLVGDILDVLAPFLFKEAGHDVQGEQDELDLHGLKGHRDCVVDGVTVDVKTANSRSIEKFKKHELEKDDPFGYIKQIGSYVAAGRDDPLVQIKKQGAFVVFDKERGGLVLDTYYVGDGPTKEEIDATRELVSSPEVPDRHYSPVSDGSSGNLVLPFQCAYCSHKKTCWQDANKGIGLRKFIYSTGPKWFTRIFKEPNVPEVSL